MNDTEERMYDTDKLGLKNLTCVNLNYCTNIAILFIWQT